MAPPPPPPASGALAAPSSEPVAAERPPRSLDGALALTVMLAAISSMGPFALQAIAPGLPSIGRALEVAPAAAQLLVTLAVFAMAAGAVVYGPLADRFGRRPVLLASLVLTGIGAGLAALAPSFGFVLVGRVLQSLGAGAGLVLARAVARDLFGRDGAAAMIGRITGLMVIAPMLAPVIGGVVIEAVGWRGLFAGIALFAAVLFLWVRARFEETLATPSARLDLAAVLGDFGRILRSRPFRAYAAYASLSIATFFLFVGAAPYLMETRFGLGPAGYGLLFILVSLVYMSANFASAAAARRFGPERLVQVMPLVAAGAAATMAGLAALGVGGVGVGGALVVVGACMANACAAGLAQPHAFAGAVGAAPDRAGSASGLLSVLQFSAAGVAAQAASWLPPDAAWALPLAMSMLGLAAAAAFRVFGAGRP